MTSAPGRASLGALVVMWLALLAPLAWGQTPAQGASATAAALRLIEATPAIERASLVHPFTEESRSDWHSYDCFPHSRTRSPDQKGTGALPISQPSSSRSDQVA